MKKYFFWIKSVFFETLIVFSSFFFFLLKKGNFKWKNKEYKKFCPILLIQGYMHNSYVWMYHGKNLKKNGFGPIYTINFTKALSSIEQHALEVQKKVEEILEENKTKNLILIGHSMGGLIASYYALNLEKENHITDVISIASPYEGSAFAKIAIGKCGEEMKKNSDFIEELRKKIEKEENINFYFISSKTDQLVRPESALIGIKTENQYVINDLGHATLLFSKKVNNQICRWILG
jgi:triacylglycerol lipase